MHNAGVACTSYRHFGFVDEFGLSLCAVMKQCLTMNAQTRYASLRNTAKMDAHSVATLCVCFKTSQKCECNADPAEASRWGVYLLKSHHRISWGDDSVQWIRGGRRCSSINKLRLHFKRPVFQGLGTNGLIAHHTGDYQGACSDWQNHFSCHLSRLCTGLEHSYKAQREPDGTRSCWVENIHTEGQPALKLCSHPAQRRLRLLGSLFRQSWHADW